MKKICIFVAIIMACMVVSGCTYRIGNVQGVINPFLVPVGGYGYSYQNVPICRPWGGHIVCENVAMPQQVYYGNAPFNPGYGWQSWYYEPGFTVFIGNDGRHHRHPNGNRGRRR